MPVEDHEERTSVEPGIVVSKAVQADGQDRLVPRASRAENYYQYDHEHRWYIVANADEPRSYRGYCLDCDSYSSAYWDREELAAMLGL